MAKSNRYDWASLSEAERKKVVTERHEKRISKLLKINLTKVEIEKMASEYNSVTEVANSYGIEPHQFKRFLESNMYSEFETGLDYFNRINSKKGDMNITIFKNETLEDILNLTRKVELEERFSLMYTLFSKGYKEKCRCEHCKQEIPVRPIDYKVPMMIYFKDSDPSNTTLENIQIVCYNCYFLLAGQFAYKTVHKFDKFRNKNPKIMLDSQWEIPWQFEPKIMEVKLTGFTTKQTKEKLEKTIKDDERLQAMKEKFRLTMMEKFERFNQEQ